MASDLRETGSAISAVQIRERLGRFLKDRSDGRGRARAQCSILARGVGLKFGDDVRATRTLLELITITPGDSGQLPDLSRDARVRIALNDAYTVFTLFAAVRPDRLNNVGLSFAAAARKAPALVEGVDWRDRNFERLLGLSRDEIDSHLVRIAKRMGRDVMASVDPARLFEDLRGWNSPSRSVKRDWSYQLWATPENAFNEATTGSEGSKK